VDTVVTVVGTLSPGDPPPHMPDVPHGYHNQFLTTRDLANAGFRDGPAFEVVEKQSAGTGTTPVALSGDPPQQRDQVERRWKAAGGARRRGIGAGRAFGFGPIVGKIRALTATDRK
jgi:hypothetical protein